MIYDFPSHDPKDNEYLATIAESSPDLATDVFTAEYSRHRKVHLWLIDVIECAAWSWSLHKGGRCGCVFCRDNIADPVIRVTAVARAAKRLVQAACEKEDVEPLQFSKDHGYEQFAEAVLSSRELLEELAIARADRMTQLAGQLRRWETELRRED